MRNGSTAEDNAIRVKFGHNKNPYLVGVGCVLIEIQDWRPKDIRVVWYLTYRDREIQDSEGSGSIMKLLLFVGG